MNFKSIINESFKKIRNDTIEENILNEEEEIIKDLNIMTISEEIKEFIDEIKTNNLVNCNLLYKLQTISELSYFNYEIAQNSHLYLLSNTLDFLNFMKNEILNENYEKIDIICLIIENFLNSFDLEDLINLTLFCKNLMNFSSISSLFSTIISIKRLPSHIIFPIVLLQENEHFIYSLITITKNYPEIILNNKNLVEKIILINIPGSFLLFSLINFTTEEIINFNIFKYAINSLRSNSFPLINSSLKFLSSYFENNNLRNIIFNSIYEVFLEGLFLSKLTCIHFLWNELDKFNENEFFYLIEHEFIENLDNLFEYLIEINNSDQILRILEILFKLINKINI